MRTCPPTITFDNSLDTAASDTKSAATVARELASMMSHSETLVSALTGTLTAAALTWASAFARIFSDRSRDHPSRFPCVPGCVPPSCVPDPAPPDTDSRAESDKRKASFCQHLTGFASPSAEIRSSRPLPCPHRMWGRCSAHHGTCIGRSPRGPSACTVCRPGSSHRRPAPADHRGMQGKPGAGNRSPGPARRR